MSKINQLEYHVQSFLSKKAERIQIPPDLFARIDKELTADSVSNGQSKLNLNCWRVAVIFMIAFTFTGMMLLLFSREARVMAAQMVDSIKTIFVVEKVDGHYQAIVKPISEFQLSQGLCMRLFGVDDSSLRQKAGFKVAYPESLDGYRLEFKAIGVKLDRKMDVDTFNQLEDRIQKAFDDNQALASLKFYDAHRYTGACYRKGDTVIGIYVMNRTYRITHNIIKKVTFQGSQGFWLEHPRNQFFKDKQTEAVNLQIRHSLFWVKNGRGFYLRPEGGPDVNYYEALRIAELFSKGY